MIAITGSFALIGCYPSRQIRTHNTYYSRESPPHTQKYGERGFHSIPAPRYNERAYRDAPPKRYEPRIGLPRDNRNIQRKFREDVERLRHSRSRRR